MQFVGRKRELEILTREHGRAANSLTIVYGRRRVGKTRLLIEFMKRSSSPTVYCQLVVGTAATIYSRITERVRKQLEVSIPEMRNSSDFVACLEILMDRFKGKKLIFVLDEFPRLIKADPGLDSFLQEFWDSKCAFVEEPNLHLIICGSASTVVKRTFMSKQMPLYGRKTLSLEVSPLELGDLLEFFGLTKKYGALVFSIAGGVPYYWERLQVPKAKTLEKFTTELLHGVFSPESAFLDEPYFVLSEEVETPAVYMDVLRATATMYWCTLGRITGRLQMGANRLAPYVRKLSDMGVIFIEENPIKKKKRLYSLRDPFLLFWFNFIEPLLDPINAGIDPLELAKDQTDSFKKYLERFYELWWRQVLAGTFNGLTMGKAKLRAGKVTFSTTKGGEVDLDLAITGKDSLLMAAEIHYGIFGKKKLAQLRKSLESLKETLGLDTDNALLVSMAPGIVPEVRELVRHLDFPVRISETVNEVLRLLKSRYR